MQRVRVGHLLLDEVALVVLNVDVQAERRDHPPLAERIFGWVPQRDELVVALESWVREAADPFGRLLGDRSSPAQLGEQRLELGARWRPVEAAHPDVDGMDLPAAEPLHDVVTGPLDAEALLDPIAVRLGHGERVRVAEEIRGVQQKRVQRVALDPFTEIEQPPQVPQRAADPDPERVLHGVTGAEQVGGRADAADARGDVGGLQMRAPAEERLEEARRLEDSQPHLGGPIPFQLDEERPFPFDPGQLVDLYRARAGPTTWPGGHGAVSGSFGRGAPSS